MGTDGRWTIFLGDEGWRIARVNAATIEFSDASPLDRRNAADFSGAIVQSLRDQGYAGQPLVVALGSSWCVSAFLAVPTPRHARNRTAMSYLLEPYVPWASEDMVVDYELQDANAFMVATPIAPLAELIDKLESEGVRVESITPSARLALARQMSEHRRLEDRYLLLWGHDEGTELWQIGNNRPVAWQWLPNEARGIARAVRQSMLLESGAIPIYSRALSANVSQELAGVGEIAVHELEPENARDCWDFAAREAAAIASGNRNAPIELRRDGLGVADRRRSLKLQLRALQVAVMAVLAVIGSMFFLKAHQYDDLRRNLGNRELAVYRQVFPEGRDQVGVRARLESEVRRLRGMRGTNENLPESIAAASVLECLLRALPNDIRLRLLEIRIESGRLNLVGQVRTHGDADRIAEELRTVDLSVLPPSTVQLQTDGVEFRISARLEQTTESEIASAK